MAKPGDYAWRDFNREAAFNQADDMFGLANPINGLKKQKSEPRLASITPEEEQAIYGAIESSEVREHVRASITTPQATIL